MLKIDHTSFVEALRALYAACGREPTEAQVGAYWKTLEKQPIERVRTAMVLAARRSGDFPPTAGKVFSVCESLVTEDDKGKAAICLFSADGRRCIYGAHYPAIDPTLCPDHWEVRADPAAGQQLLMMILDGKMPYRPSSSLVLLARHMLRDDVIRDPLLGQRMADYLRDHPESETHPAWARRSPVPRGNVSVTLIPQPPPRGITWDGNNQ